jgi:hypothetical protein
MASIDITSIPNRMKKKYQNFGTEHISETAWPLSHMLNVGRIPPIAEGKAVPLQAWPGPYDSRRSRLADF